MTEIMGETQNPGRLRLSISAVAAPENAPPMITTSYSKFIATGKVDAAGRKRNPFWEGYRKLDVGRWTLGIGRWTLTA